MYIPKINSTNTYLLEQLTAHDSQLTAHGSFVYTFEQTAGRGQVGNSWESEAGKNLLFSRLIRPNLGATEAFRITQWVSIVIHEALSTYFSIDNRLSIKWPNDIYYGDKKLCGILIESGLKGKQIDYAIAGVGINVNQTVFHSGAPNPISLINIIGQEIDLEMLMQRINAAFEQYNDLLYNPTQLQAIYLQRLYRREGWWYFSRREVSLEPTQITSATDNSFEGHIADILPTGELLLEHRDGSKEQFHFKEIRYVI